MESGPTAGAAHDYWEDRGLVQLMAALFVGPVAAGLHLQISYALVKWTCATGGTVVLIAVAALACGLSLAGAWLAWSLLARMRQVSEDGGRRIDRSFFLAIVAIGLDVLLALFVVISAFAVFVLSPCE